MSRSPNGRASLRRRLCDAHDGVALAVATVNVSGPGASWQVALCAQHLAVFEAELDDWASPS